MSILIDNLQGKIEIMENTRLILDKSIKLSLESEGFDIPSEISVILVDDERIREINREHRNMDKPTDVLSFPMVNMFEGKILSDEGDFDMDEEVILLGDIIISLETAVKQADEYGHSLERELAFLATHGVFHLLGYDHEDADGEQLMMGKQEAVLAKMGLSR